MDENEYLKVQGNVWIDAASTAKALQQSVTEFVPQHWFDVRFPDGLRGWMDKPPNRWQRFWFRFFLGWHWGRDDG